MNRPALVTLVVAALAPALACAPDGPDTASFTLLQANVGNVYQPCAGYVYKLCRVDVEERIAQRIDELQPDVLALQEVLPERICDGLAAPEADPALVCHASHTAEVPAQIDRLLPDGYHAVCDERNGYECVAARDGIELSEYTTQPPVTDPNPDGAEECDDGFTVGHVDVTLPGGALRLVNGHPQSGFVGRCRAAQLEQALAIPPLEGATTVLSGDWNLDPFVPNDDPSALLWNEHVGTGKRFAYHSGPAEREPPYLTVEVLIFAGILDHVVSDGGLAGTCQTLGAHPNTEPLDAGDLGTDHRALSCALSFAD